MCIRDSVERDFKGAMAECRTMAHFLRKCVLEKEIYIVDLEPFRILQGQLANVTNNINQIARATNITGVIYRDDINFMKREIERISRQLLQIYSLLPVSYTHLIRSL